MAIACRALALPVLCICAAAAVLAQCAGCASPRGEYAAPPPGALEAANAERALAYDLRCDGAFDWRAECAPEPERARLAALRADPPDNLAELRGRAERLNDNWRGK